jgi:hypothetical protein
LSKKRASLRRPQSGTKIEPDGSVSVPASPEKLEIELAKLPTIALSGFVDACLVRDRGLVVEVRFTDTAAQRTIARIVVPKGDLFDNLWTGGIEDFYTSTKAMLAEVGVAVIPVQESLLDDAGAPPAFPAHIFRVGRLGLEAEMEIYYLSVSSAGTAAVIRSETPSAETRITIYPVSRIYLSVPVLAGVLSYLRGKRGSRS